MYMDSVDLEDDHIKETFQQVFKNQSVSDLVWTNIEKNTRVQNKNNQWFKARTQRITASKFGCIVKRKSSSKPDSVLNDVMGYRAFDNKYCLWGRSHEPAAHRTYANSRRDTKAHTCGLLVNTCGLLVNEKKSLFGRQSRYSLRELKWWTGHFGNQMPCFWQVAKCSSWCLCERLRFLLIC